MAQSFHGRADVGADGMPKEGFRLVPELCGEKSFNSGPNAIDDGAESLQRTVTGSPKSFQGRLNGPATRMPQDHDKSRTELSDGELDTPYLGGSGDVSSDTDHEKVAQILIEDDLCRRT